MAELGAQISRDYAGKNLVLVSILKGSVVFMADLMRAVSLSLIHISATAQRPSGCAGCSM